MQVALAQTDLSLCLEAYSLITTWKSQMGLFTIAHRYPAEASSIRVGACSPLAPLLQHRYSEWKGCYAHDGCTVSSQ